MGGDGVGMGGRGHKISTKQNLLASFSCILFYPSGWNLLWCWSNSSCTFWYCFWVRFKETREITAVLLTTSKNFGVGTHLGIYESIWFKHGMMIDAIVLFSLIQFWLTLTLIQSHRSVKTQENIWANILIKVLISLDGIWYTVEALWCDKLIVILSHPSDIQGKKNCPYVTKIKFNINLYSNIFRPISFKLGMKLKTTKLCFNISFDSIDLQSRSHV